MDRLRVVLAEDHARIAEQLRALLEPEFDVVAAVADGTPFSKPWTTPVPTWSSRTS